MNTITVLSISTGDISLLSAGTLDAFHAARRIYLRTSRHPVIHFDNKIYLP